MRRFFSDAPMIVGQTAMITGAEVRHIRNVLRLSVGDRITLFNGKGQEFQAEISNISSDRVDTMILQSSEPSRESFAEIIIAQAFLKEKKMDDLIRPISELGITRWIPFIAQRSVARPDDKRLASRYERWNSIARESLKQCRRTKMLEIAPLMSFEQILDIGKSCDIKLIFWENASEPIPNQGDRIMAILGPEGGFSHAEIAMAKQAKFIPVTLGTRILRSETAAIAAASILQYRFGDMNPSQNSIANQV